MNIVYQVWEAVEEDNRMPTGTKIVLEVLSKDDDGIFPSKRSWDSFLTSNFGDGEKGIYLTGEPRKGLLKKYCYRLEQYKHLCYRISVKIVLKTPPVIITTIPKMVG